MPQFSWESCNILASEVAIFQLGSFFKGVDCDISTEVVIVQGGQLYFSLEVVIVRGGDGCLISAGRSSCSEGDDCHISAGRLSFFMGMVVIYTAGSILLFRGDGCHILTKRLSLFRGEVAIFQLGGCHCSGGWLPYFSFEGCLFDGSGKLLLISQKE